MISDIELMMNDSTSLFDSITNNLKIWRERVAAQKKFKDEWNEFLIYTRKLIQRATEVEENFLLKNFPTFESSLSNSYQHRLEELMTVVKVIKYRLCLYRSVGS
jgi:hypothetical protein